MRQTDKQINADILTLWCAEGPSLHSNNQLEAEKKRTGAAG